MQLAHEGGGSGRSHRDSAADPRKKKKTPVLGCRFSVEVVNRAAVARLSISRFLPQEYPGRRSSRHVAGLEGGEATRDLSRRQRRGRRTWSPACGPGAVGLRRCWDGLERWALPGGNIRIQDRDWVAGDITGFTSLSYRRRDY